jgi:hypothetical protein
MTFLIIYGLLSGLATPTETAVVASVYAFVVGAFIYGELPIRKVPGILVDSAVVGGGHPGAGRLRQCVRLDPRLRAHPAGHRRRCAVGHREQVPRDPADQPACCSSSACSWRPSRR